MKHLIYILFLFFSILGNTLFSQANSDTSVSELNLRIADKILNYRNTDSIIVIPDFVSEDSLLISYVNNGYTITQFPVAGKKMVIKTKSIIIRLLLTDSIGITSTCSFNLEVKNTANVGYYNFFSPNGDEKNDLWLIPQLEKYPNNEVKVYDRWGNLVYSQKNFKSWDGKTNQKITNSNATQKGSSKLPVGTYYYIIDLGDGSREPYTGYVQIRG